MTKKSVPQFIIFIPISRKSMAGALSWWSAHSSFFGKTESRLTVLRSNVNLREGRSMPNTEPGKCSPSNSTKFHAAQPTLHGYKRPPIKLCAPHINQLRIKQGPTDLHVTDPYDHKHIEQANQAHADPRILINVKMTYPTPHQTKSASIPVTVEEMPSGKPTHPPILRISQSLAILRLKLMHMRMKSQILNPAMQFAMMK